MARAAEHGKLDAVLLTGVRRSESPVDGRADDLRLDPLPLLGSLIGVTEQIGLGAAWTVEHAEPFHVARVFATLDHLSGGRSAWVAGLSEGARFAANFGHAKQPASDTAALERAVEFLDVVRALWDSWEDEGLLLDVPTGRFADPARVHPLHHAGRFFTVRGPLNVPRPVQGNPLVVMTVPDEAAGRRLVAAAADVLLLNIASPETALALRRSLETLILAAGRQSASIRVLVNIMPILGETQTMARTRAAELDALLPPGDEPAMRFVGTPGQFVDLCGAWIEAGCCDGFNLMPAVLPDDLTELLRAVVPLAQSRGLLRTDYAGTTLRDHMGLARPRSRFAV
jgi:alkanesulfonate monooxygenase SsuD/methylene tetrahydromethanopterin reductase-like flavin-dependent oxidoreductase (luciferase family)